MSKQMDINCDMGESFGSFIIGNDQAIFPHISSCNIACGFHGGDPMHMENAIRQALLHGVRIGAHPSYPDLAGFGRRKMDVPEEELKAIIKYQVAALKGMVESVGGQLAYVKPHGALYNSTTEDESVALAVIQAVRDIHTDLKLMGLAGSMLESLAQQKSMPFIAEAFADRRYQADGRLTSRSLQSAVLTDPNEAAEQAISIVLTNQVSTVEGVNVKVNAQSICVHGDNPAALSILKAIKKAFEANQIFRGNL